MSAAIVLRMGDFELHADHLSMLIWPHAKVMLEALGMGRLVLPLRSRRKPAGVDPRQGGCGHEQRA